MSGDLSVKHFIVATAGHVDHGKTALVQALTGTNTDRLPEEKARGITIDLGFAHLALPGFSIGIIDVPGHEDFVRNMITGVGAVDLALLVVAADDGWMPQTEEHLQILIYLGVTRLVVALTKSDLGNIGKRSDEIREKLQDTLFANAPIVPTSICSLDSVEKLKATLAQEIGQLPAPRDFQKPRLFVDRVFSIRGSGTIVTGTLSGGSFTRGENVLILPQNLTARIRSLQSHNQPLEVAGPRKRLALNLADLAPQQLARGATICTAQSGGSLSCVVDVLLTRSSRLAAGTRPIRDGAMLHFHFGGTRQVARVQLRDHRELLPNGKALARIHLETPACFLVGDRFILRDSSERQTIAGGLVLDAMPGTAQFRSREQRAFLDQRALSPNDCSTLLRTELARDRFVPRVDLLRSAPFSQEEVAAALEELQGSASIFFDGKIAAHAAWWKSTQQAAAALIDAEHTGHPERQGFELSRLRESLRLSNADLFEALVRGLAENGYSRRGNVLQRVNFRPALAPHLQAARDRIRALLEARPLDPPTRTELARATADSQVLRFLSETGEVVLLGEDLAMSAEGFTKMKGMIEEHLHGGRSATVSELRQATGSTRRVLVPLLEHLDKIGLTIRAGDRRRLR